MQREEKVGSSLELKKPLAIRALRRSNVRKRIAEYLFDISPSYSYTMRGMQTRYKEDESLLNLDMVEEKNCGNNIRLYGITDFGKEMLKTIKDRR